MGHLTENPEHDNAHHNAVKLAQDNHSAIAFMIRKAEDLRDGKNSH
jgi:hypothetical protein